jgi:NadR type nicotinamide-nucleotide adenylyltransferase
MAAGGTGDGLMLRVVLSGVESVGKSTMSRELAAHFQGLFVPEYGRTYTEKLRRDLTLEDHYAIALGHELDADEAAAKKPPVLVEDTDIVMTTAWATMLFGGRDSILADQASKADLHLLLWPDVPFVKDKVRMFGYAGTRARFHEVVLGEYAARAISYVVVKGSWAERWNTAVATVKSRL